jgi:hypothetical protein
VMRVLIYKRTHPFDPSTEGVFGCEDCMGAVRRRRFQAVIGVGGIGAEPRRWGIDRRLNWVGVGAHVSEIVPMGYRGPLVTFDRFLLLEDQGPMLGIIAPALAHHVFSVHRRVVMSDGLSAAIQRDIRRILALTLPRREGRFRRSPGGVLPAKRCSPRNFDPMRRCPGSAIDDPRSKQTGYHPRCSCR